MAVNSADFLKQTNNNNFTVSTVGGAVKVLSKYWGQGRMEIGISAFSVTSAQVIKDFPYDFRIIGAEFQTYSFGKASHAVSLYHTATNATGFIGTFALTASRLLVVPTTLNFNKVNVSTTHKLYLNASGASSANLHGKLILYVRAI